MGLAYSSFLISIFSAFSIYLGVGGGGYFASSTTFSGFCFASFYTSYFISYSFSLISIFSAFSIFWGVGGGVVSSMTFSGFC